jgi:hypothetical protein
MVVIPVPRSAPLAPRRCVLFFAARWRIAVTVKGRRARGVRRNFIAASSGANPLRGNIQKYLLNVCDPRGKVKRPHESGRFFRLAAAVT